MDTRLVNYDESPDSPDNACTGTNQINNSSQVEPDTSTSMVSEIPDTRTDISDVAAALTPAEVSVAPVNPVSTVSEVTVTKDPLISAALNLVGAEQVSEEMKIKLEEMRVRTGNDPESAEIEQLTLPEQTIINADLHHLKRRNVFVSALTMGEFSHPHVLEVMAHCQEFKVSFVQRPEATPSLSFWEGCMTFRMRTLSDAKEAILHLKDIRSDLTVRLLKITENVYDVMERWQRIATTASDESSKETDHLLVVKNLPAGATEAKLHHLFPDALEIVVATKSQAGKCSAYLMFSGKVQSEEAYKKYSSKNISYDGNLLRIHKYISPKTIPEDFLHLGERFRVLSMLERFIATYQASPTLCISTQIQHKIKEAISYLLSIANLDAIARKFLGLPSFSLDELHLLLDLPRSSPGGMGLLPVPELLSLFNTEQDRLKDSKTTRKFCGNNGEPGAIQSDNSDTDSERRDRTLRAVDSPHARSQLRRSFEKLDHSRMPETRVPYSPRRTTPFSSATAQKRSALKPLAPSAKRSRFSAASYGRDYHYRYHQTTASRSYSSYRRTVHHWSTGSHRIPRYCTKIQPRDHNIRGSRILRSSQHRH